jgi:protein-S-isoprenylcysteine O-methyltransferase Ste14
LLIIKKNESEVVSFSVHCLMTCYVYNSSHNCMGNNIAVVLLVLVKICHINDPKGFYVIIQYNTYTNVWSIICSLEVRCLTPLSTIFNLLLLWQKLEYPEKTTDLSQVTEKLLSHSVLSSTSLHAWSSNSQHKWW